MNITPSNRRLNESLSAAAVADDCLRAVETFCGDVRAATPELDFAPHRLASDLLSVCALGAVTLSQKQANLSERAGRAMFALLLSRQFGWRRLEAWVRAEAFWADEPAPDSGLAHWMEEGMDVFRSWQTVPGNKSATALGARLHRAVQLAAQAHPVTVEDSRGRLALRAWLGGGRLDIRAGTCLESTL